MRFHRDSDLSTVSEHVRKQIEHGLKTDAEQAFSIAEGQAREQMGLPRLTPAQQQLEREERKAKREKLELTLIQELEAERLGTALGMVREFVGWHPTRRWRFDLAWPDRMLAVEVEGLTYETGRHQRVDGYTEDCQKYNQALICGWRVLRYTRPLIESGYAVHELKSVLTEGMSDERSSIEN